METKVNYTLVGVFVLAFGAALVGVVYWLSIGDTQYRQYLKYLAYFDESVSGLNLNAAVRFRGVEVGRVAEIDLAPDQSGRVRVLMKIDRATPINADTYATLKIQGLTGLANVELAGGTMTSKALTQAKGEPYPVIKTKYSLLKKLDVTVNTLLENLVQTSANLNALTDVETRRSTKQLLTNLARLTQSLAEQQPALGDVLRSAGRTLEAGGNAAAEIGKLSRRLDQTARVVEGMAGEIGAASRGVRGTLEEARPSLRVLSGQTLPELQSLVGEMRDVAATMKRIGAELEQRPEILVFGRGEPKPGPGEPGSTR